MKAWLAARDAAALGGALGAGFEEALRRWNIVQFGILAGQLHRRRGRVRAMAVSVDGVKGSER